MANNYTQFSVMLPYQNEEEREWIQSRLTEWEGSEDGLEFEYEDQPERKAFWIYAGESGNVERVAELVADFQDQFNLSTQFLLEWANTCSKMRLGEFSGGAVAVYRGQIEFFNPGLLADDWLQRQKKEG